MNTTATTDKISRPINCFMIFRLEKYPEIQSKSPKMNHRDISKVIAKWWKEMPESKKETYRIKAAKAKKEHAKMYPSYKYRPAKKSERKVRQYCRREDLETRQRKAKESELAVKHWLEVDAQTTYSPINDHPTPFTDLDSLVSFPSDSTFSSSPEITIPSSLNLENDFDLFPFSPVDDMTLQTQSWVESNTAFYSQPPTPLDATLLSMEYNYFFLNAITDIFSQCDMMDSSSFTVQSPDVSLKDLLFS